MATHYQLGFQKRSRCTSIRAKMVQTLLRRKRKVPCKGIYGKHLYERGLLNYLTMTTLYTTTQKGLNFWKAYYQSKNYSLTDCFKTCSQEKRRAEHLCRRKMRGENGYDFRILSWNTFQFTCGWQLRNGDIRIETANNSYYIIDLPF